MSVQQLAKIRLRRGDNVAVLAGRDKGKQGKIIQVFPKLGMVVVEGVNQRTKHLRSRSAGKPGQRLTFNAPLDASKVSLICPNCNKLTRVSYQLSAADGVKLAEKGRVCHHCKQLV